MPPTVEDQSSPFCSVCDEDNQLIVSEPSSEHGRITESLDSMIFSQQATPIGRNAVEAFVVHPDKSRYDQPHHRFSRRSRHKVHNANFIICAFAAATSLLATLRSVDSAFGQTSFQSTGEASSSSAAAPTGRPTDEPGASLNQVFQQAESAVHNVVTDTWENVDTETLEFSDPFVLSSASQPASPYNAAPKPQELSDHILTHGDGLEKKIEEDSYDDVIVVATIQGELIGLSRKTGLTLWKHSRLNPTAGNNEAGKPQTKRKQPAQPNSYDINSIWSDEEWDRLLSPLVSTSTTTKSSSSDSNTVAVPSVDGRVYLTPPPEAGGRVDMADSMSTGGTLIRSLVNRAPFVDARGRFYVGSRRSTAAAIDRDTGEILRVIKGEEGTSRPTSSPLEDVSPGLPSLEGRKIVWIGRVDHSVTIYNARTGNVDVNFSSSEILSLSDMIGNYVLSSDGGIDAEEGVGSHRIHGPQLGRLDVHQYDAISSASYFDENMEDSDDMLLLSTPGGKLAMRGVVPEQSHAAFGDDEQADENESSASQSSSSISWVANNGHSFSSPIAFAISAETGTSLKVDIVPDAPINTDSTTYLSERFGKQLDALVQQQQQSRESHGIHSGGTEGKTIVGALPSHQLFALPLGRSSGAGGRSSAPTYAGKHFASKKVPPTLSGTVSKSVSPNLSSIPKHPLHDWHKKSLPPVKQVHDFMQHSHQYHSSASASPPASSSGGDGSSGTSAGGKSLSARKCVPTSPTYPACLIGFRDNIIPLPPTPSPDDNVEEEDYDVLEILNIGGQKEKHRSAFYLFIRVMTSWIPPLIALVFVISFELGRRERHRAETANQIPNVQALENRRSSDSSKIATQQITGNANGYGNTILLQQSTDASDLDVEQESEPEAKRITSIQEHHVIKVSNEILGYGGHGTVVYKGTLDGRKIAVKRMLKAYHASADREIGLLIESDGHPNVVRYFLKEVRGDFVYLALELCDLSLADLIYAVGSNRTKVGLGCGQESAPFAALSDCTTKALYQIAAGVRHLHSLRIVHRDLKPQNILLALRNRRGDEQLNRRGQIVDDESWKSSVYFAFETDQLVPKISDMGLGKQLAGQSSFGASTLGQLSVGFNGDNAASIGLAGPGSVGWTAPEVMAMRSSDPSGCLYDQGSSEASPMDNSSLTSRRTSRSVDIFSLGCIFYCTLLPGLHPFGDWYEREANIMRGKPDTGALKKISAEAFALVNSMLSRDPRARPTAEEVCAHPFFWKPLKRLAFLSEFSDRIELQADNLALNLLVVRVETNASAVIGLAWDKDLDPDLISNVSKFRTYDPSSVRDCLRMIRNKYHHFNELPDSVKERVGYTLSDLLRYFERKFPGLLMHCYNLCSEMLPKGDPLVVKYSVPSRTSVANPVSVRCGASSVDDSQVAGKEIQDIHNGPELPERTSEVVADAEERVTDTNDANAVESTLLPEYECTIVCSESEDASPDNPNERPCIEEEVSACQPLGTPTQVALDSIPLDVVIWEGSSTARLLNCRGWMRSEEEWRRRTDIVLRKRDANLTRCVDDPKFRTRLCNHWDVSGGTYCPMRKKNKCVFAHGPVELRVKEGKRRRWGTLVDESGNNNNPFHSGGEDTYGAARSIECKRKEDGKWNADKSYKSPKKAQKPKGTPKGKESDC